jgi:glycerate kinase
VLTGEGRFDRQTALGKGPGALAREARALGKHTVMFAGVVAPEVAASDSPFDEVVHAEALRHAGAWWASRRK